MAVMFERNWPTRWTVAIALAAALVGSGWLVQAEVNRLRDAFDTQARIIHRLLSQQMVQHEAVLSTLTLLPPSADAAIPLTAVYPHIRRVQLMGHEHRSPDAGTPPAPTQQAAPPALQSARLTATDWATGRYTLTAQGAHARVAMDMDLSQWPRPPEWPEPSADMPLAVELIWNRKVFLLQPQPAPGWAWTFQASKAIASDSQPFTVHTQTHLTWVHMPWASLGAWWLAMAFLTGLGLAWYRQRNERQRAQALLKLDQVSRLGTLAEVGAGVAHEINQPLTAVLANAQTARRALKDSPPDIAMLGHALDQTVQQAKRAAGVVTRLRQLLERPGERQPMRRVDMREVAHHVLDLLAPSLQRLQVSAHVHASHPVHVLADPIALEQIVHNLVQNALQSMEHIPASERQLALTLQQAARRGMLTVTDTGTGIAPELLPRLFEPFLTTRPNGLGLGLTLCETLASHMGGSLRADNHAPRGALFELSLPLASVPHRK
jgi:signal transduction histidine kinase